MRTDRIVALFALLALAAGCAPVAARRTPRAVVAVARAEAREAPYVIMASGTVEARQSASLSSPVGGVLQRVLFREGQDVHAGQPLFQIDPRPFQTALAQARGVLARDRAQARVARIDADRAHVLVAQKLISEQEFDTKHSAA